MVNLTAEELAALKGEGFLLMKDKEQFVLRIVFPAGLATAEDLKKLERRVKSDEKKLLEKNKVEKYGKR